MTRDTAPAIEAAKMNPFSNHSNVALADVMGDIDTQIDLLRLSETAARQEMTRRRLSALEGARFTVVKAVVDTHTLDSRRVRREMGDDWYEARQKDGTRTTYTVSAKPPEDLGVPA